MKDLKYLLLLIGFVIIAHATKRNTDDINQAKFLPDMPDYKDHKEADSGRVDATYRQIVVPVIYNY